MKTRKQFLVAAVVLTAAMSMARGAVKPTEKSSALPAIWQGVSPQERLKAVRVAELDALRLLVERIYGVQLDSATTVYDLVLADDSMRASVARTIKGVATTEEPDYKEDGQVWVVRAVTLRQVLETITETVKKKEVFGRMITTDRLRQVQTENRDRVIDVLGNGALPGSDGLRKIRAKRAAEIDAYRKLAERLMGVRVTSSTTVKDFCLQSDVIRARTAQLVKGAKPTAIDYDLSDLSCEVTLQIKVADVYEVIKRYTKHDRKILQYEKQYETTTFTETGRGAPRPLTDEGFEGWALGSPADAVDGAYQETEVIIRRLVGQEVVVE